jgi:predicted NBD/HSP70 family sugar kinase
MDVTAGAIVIRSDARSAACAEGKRFRGNVYYVTDVMVGAIVIWDRRPVRGRSGWPY